MILDAIISVLLTIVGGFIGLFPAYTLPSTVTNMGDALGGALATANGIFPVVVLGGCLAAIVGLMLFMHAVDVIAWVYRLIPLKFT